MLPFLIHMSQLFEQFVAQWLKQHLPLGWRVQVQERVQHHSLRFEIDLVLYNPQNQPVAVLDTKYKAPDKPSNADFSQVVTYANLKGVPTAVLVYPAPLSTPLDVTVRGVRVLSLPFRLDGDLQEAGQAFLASLPSLI